MYLAIDIGGTKTLIALFSRYGRVLRRFKFKTAKEAGDFIRDLKQNLLPFQKYKVKAVAVAIPGLVQKNYSVKFGNRDWDGIDIFTPISELFTCPIFFENDANLATLYESRGLKGRTVFLTFSTGIGGGVAEKGVILPESSKFEPGHQMYEFDGKVAEWEDIAAASAIEKRFGVEYATDIRDKGCLEEIAQRIYLGLPDIAAQYKPRNIILGGPMGRIFKLYAKYIPKIPGVTYRRPKRPLESVIYGCYIYAKQRTGR